MWPDRAAATAAILCAATSAAAEPRFEPVLVPLHTYVGGWEHFVGGGLAVFDCNADGLPELFAAGGANPSVLLRNVSEKGGAVRFDSATPKALQVTGATGAYPVDLNNDTFADLVILRAGRNHIVHGGPDCTFDPNTPQLPDLGDRWTTAFSATWEAGHTLPTLAFGHYVDRSDPNGPFETCDIGHLLRPLEGAYPDPLELRPGFCPLSMLFSDWNRQGRADLRISNDRHYYVRGGSEQMWAMEKAPRLYTGDDGWQTHALWGMGIASRDLSGDGLPEVYLTSMGDQRFQERMPEVAGPAYRHVPFARGTAAHRPYTGGDGRPSTGWHVAFGDVQNDGRDDIFVTKGNVEQMPGSAMDDPNNLLVQAPDGTFAELGAIAGLSSMHRARGGALVDLNADGLLDVAVVNRRAPLEVWQNRTGDTGAWLQISLGQPAPNTHAVGAWIEMKTPNRIIAREVTVGGGHAGGALGAEHFGLGPLEEVRIRVIWPDGTRSDWVPVSANQAVTVSKIGATGLGIAELY